MALMREIQIIIDNEPPTKGEFSIHVEEVEVSSFGSDPDPHWTYIDANGHFHAYTADMKLPTLVVKDEWVEYEEPDEDGETGYSIRHLHCAICNEEIRPGRISAGGFRKFAPGRKSWSVVVNAPGALGEKKSVRVISGDQMHFGVGVVGAIRDDHGRPALEIYGIGELGSRRAPQRVTGG